MLPSYVSIINMISAGQRCFGLLIPRNDAIANFKKLSLLLRCRPA